MKVLNKPRDHCIVNKGQYSVKYREQTVAPDCTLQLYFLCKVRLSTDSYIILQYSLFRYVFN